MHRAKAPVLREDGGRVVIGMVMDRVDEVTVRDDVGGGKLHGPPIAGDRLFDQARVLKLRSPGCSAHVKIGTQ